MNLVLSAFYDVLIIGSGIAGLSAAVEAAERGCSSAIVCSTHLFSGSSFYPGTWGFGLVGPTDKEDEEDLVNTVCSVGCNIPDPQLVESFVSGINPAIKRLKELGCIPRKALKNDEREYIPCFDHKHRDWSGLEAPSLRACFAKHITRNQITVLEESTLLDIIKEHDKVVGIVIAAKDHLEMLGCKSLILATGGYGDLFKHHLCPSDVSGMGHYLALKTGCKLINMEFMQMMLGFLSPARNTIFNEKTYGFAQFHSNTGNLLFYDKDLGSLDIRAKHGPFTSRLPSMIVDQKIHEEYLKTGHGINVSYVRSDTLPEFVNVYFDWLKKEKNVSIEDSIEVALFAHAANGGIRIDCFGQTGVSGLFACGEVTGGMHGADRLGGLSTANGLVFGQRSGIAAAEYALSCNTGEQDVLEYHYVPKVFSNPTAIRRDIQIQMYQNAMIFRTQKGLADTIANFTDMLSSGLLCETDNFQDILASRIVECQLVTALCILNAALLRTESRGSHFRADYPDIDNRLENPIIVTYKDNTVHAEFSK